LFVGEGDLRNTHYILCGQDIRRRKTHALMDCIAFLSETVKKLEARIQELQDATPGKECPPP
jgi:hypothetical protein